MENKKSEKKNSKKIAIIAIIAVLLVAAVILCVWLLPKSSPADPDESVAPTESADPASPGSSSVPSAKPEASPAVGSADAGKDAPDQDGSKPDVPAAPTQTVGGQSNTGSGSQTVPGQTGGSTGNQTSGTQNSGHHSGDHHDEQEHQHNWQPVYKTVHHDEKGHYETVVVQAAWDEPEMMWETVCNVCGKRGGDVPFHIMDDHDGQGSYGSVQVPTGNVIHHDEVTEQRWVVDTPAYDEQVVAGYKCSCGQEKLA